MAYVARRPSADPCAVPEPDSGHDQHGISASLDASRHHVHACPAGMGPRPWARAPSHLDTCWQPLYACRSALLPKAYVPQQPSPLYMCADEVAFCSSLSKAWLTRRSPKSSSSHTLMTSVSRFLIRYIDLQLRCRSLCSYAGILCKWLQDILCCSRPAQWMTKTPTSTMHLSKVGYSHRSTKSSTFKTSSRWTTMREGVSCPLECRTRGECNPLYACKNLSPYRRFWRSFQFFHQ